MARKAKSSLFDPDVFLGTEDYGRSISECRAGQVIFSQGDAADSVFYIVRGRIKIAVTSGQGRETVVGPFDDKDFFAEGCLIGQPLRLATASAMDDATVLRIEKAEMIRVLHAEPAFAEVFTAHLLCNGAQSKCGRRAMRGGFRRTIRENISGRGCTLYETERTNGETDARSQISTHIV